MLIILKSLHPSDVTYYVRLKNNLSLYVSQLIRDRKKKNTIVIRLTVNPIEILSQAKPSPGTLRRKERVAQEETCGTLI